jgi:hypothetical protein
MIRIALYVMAGIAAFVSWAAFGSVLIALCVAWHRTGKIPPRVAAVASAVVVLAGIAAWILVTAAGDLR